MILRLFLFIAVFFIIYPSFAQIAAYSDTLPSDTLFFLNGEISPVHVVDTLEQEVRFLPEERKKKPRILESKKSEIFSIKFSNGRTSILYFYDSSLGNIFSISEAKMFMLGEREASKNYKNKWPFLIGCAVGVVSPLLLSNAILLSPIPAAIVPLHVLIPVIKVNTKKIVKKEYLQYDTYLMGYEKAARKKNFMHAILGSGIGLVCGIGVWAILK